jgi:hypothetical protein
MALANWEENDSVKAKQIWLDYGGQSVEEDLYLVDFPFDGRIVQAEATFVPGSRILMGTRFLSEYSLQINFVSKTVQLERP